MSARNHIFNKQMRKAAEERASMLFLVVYLTLFTAFVVTLAVCAQFYNFNWGLWIFGAIFFPVLIGSAIAVAYYLITAWPYLDGWGND